MRGKPKGIRRKIAKEKTSLDEKAALSKYGDVGEHPEIIDLWGAVMWKVWEHKYHEKNGVYPNAEPEPKGHKIRNRIRDEDEELTAQLAQSMVDAIKSNNVEFFEMLAELARWNRDGKQPIDKKGHDVLFAARILPRLGKKVTSTSVIKFLEDFHKKHLEDEFPIYDGREIRRILKGLGL